MEMHQIRYAVAVAHTLNFTRAAEQCNVSQPSLTRAVQKLEEELGGQLFARERSLTHLTDLGRSMIPHLQKTLRSAQEAKENALEFRLQTAAPLTLGLARGLSLTPILWAIRELGRKLSGFTLTISDGDQGEIIDRLLRGQVDIAVIEGGGELADRIDSWGLSQEKYIALLPRTHPLAMRNQIEPEDLAREVLILRKNCPSLSLLASNPDQSGGAPARHVCQEVARARELVQAGLGIAILPETDFDDDDLTSRPVAMLEAVREIVLASVCGRPHNLAVANLIKLIRARGAPHRHEASQGSDASHEV